MSAGDTLDLGVRALGWALLHSLWQGAAISVAVALLLSLLRGRTPQARYGVACLGLAAMLAAWAGTAVAVNRSLAPAAAERVRMRMAEPVAALGPAGPGDRSPAVRVFESPAALDRLEPPVSWNQRIERWAWLLVPLWLIGVGVLSFRLALSCAAVARLRRAASVPVPAAVGARAAALAERLRIRRAVRVVQSAVVNVPLVVGWIRPIVMLPVSAIAGLSPAQLEAIIAHELAHVRRHDHLVNALQRVAEVLLYYHPACWWISRRIRVEREHCCDDVAVALCGDRVAYAEALADLESRRGSAALALAAADGPLLQRVRRLIGPGPEPNRHASWAGLVAPAVVIAVLVAGAHTAARAAMAQDQSRPAAPAPNRAIPAGEAVLQGQVIEAGSARPVAGALVRATGGASSAQVQTGADGRYEISGLRPGSYMLLVRAPGFVETYYGKDTTAIMDFGGQVTAQGGRITAGLDMRLQPAGSISGRITDSRGNGLAGVEIELALARSGAGGPGAGTGGFAQTVEDGRYVMRDVSPGDYVVRAYAHRDLRPAEGDPTAVYAATFYPGVGDAGSAQPLRIYPGQELLDVDFALATSRTVRVAGRLVDPSGGLVNGTGVVLHPMSPSGSPGDENRVPADAQGRFEIRNVLPGDYMLNVMDPRRTMRWVSGQRVLAIDADLLDLELRATLGATLEGRVTRDAGAPSALDLAAVHVGFDARLEGQRGGVTGSSFPVGPDGSFSLESPGGQTQFRVKRLPRGWMVKSVLLDGAEIDDAPMDFGSGTRHVDVVLTDKLTSVAGVVVDRNGRPLANYSVVLFATDRNRWYRESRFVHAARSDNGGRFRLEALPPGAYLAVAVGGLPPAGWQDATVLERLAASAETIRIGEGQQLTISIRASPTPAGLGAGLANRMERMVVALREAAGRARALQRR